MIVMVVSDPAHQERYMIVQEAHEQAAYYTDERWDYIESGSAGELMHSLESIGRVDILCLDVTMQNAIKAAEQVRSAYPMACLILIADLSLSPVKYMRPTIRAESLMLRPLETEQIRRTLAESICAWSERMREPDEALFFVVENRGSRELIEYGKILFFESREKKIFLSTETEEYAFYDTLEELEKQLGDAFIRSHRSFLVNKSQVERVELSANRLILLDGTQIPISRTFKPAIRAGLDRKQRGVNEKNIAANISPIL